MDHRDLFSDEPTLGARLRNVPFPEVAEALVRASAGLPALRASIAMASDCCACRRSLRSTPMTSRSSAFKAIPRRLPSRSCKMASPWG